MTRASRISSERESRAGRGGYGTVWPWVLGLAVGFGLVLYGCAGECEDSESEVLFI